MCLVGRKDITIIADKQVKQNKICLFNIKHLASLKKIIFAQRSKVRSKNGLLKYKI
jgi:hypothetical protein